MRLSFRLLGWGLVLSLASSAGVHAMAGMYTAKFVDGQNVVIMANNVHDTQAEVPIAYNLRVYDLEGKPLYFGNVDVRLKQRNKTLEQCNLRGGQDHNASTTLTFPHAGTYVLEARFMDNDKQIARGEFPIVASESPRQGWLTSLASWPTVVGFVIGVAVMTLSRHNYMNRLTVRFKKWFIRQEKTPKRSH